MPGGSLGNLTTDLVIKEASGSRVRDVSGNEYIDYLLGSGPMVVGHAHPRVVAAVQEQVTHGSTFFAGNESAILLAEEIVRAVPCADTVRFSSSGTEATLYAMRAARAFRGRDKILKFEGGFHGMNDYALMSMGPSDPPDFPAAAPDSAGIPASVAGEMLIAPFNDIETTAAIIERYHDEIAGVIVEPFQRLLAPLPGFLEGLRELTGEYEIPLIFDEVVTGFRFSYGGAQEYYGVTPDLCALGKAVGGGFPLTAVAGREEIMSGFDASSAGDGFVLQVGTLSGNPVACAAGLATLEILREPGTVREALRHGATAQGRAPAPAERGRDSGGRCRRSTPVRGLLHGRRDPGPPLHPVRRQEDAAPLQQPAAGEGYLQGRLQVLPLHRPHSTGRRGDGRGVRIGGRRAERVAGPTSATDGRRAWPVPSVIAASSGDRLFALDFDLLRSCERLTLSWQIGKTS